MFNDAGDFLALYIKTFTAITEVRDARYPMTVSGDYATFLLPTSEDTSPFTLLHSTSIDEVAKTVTKTYKHTRILDAIISFRGGSCEENMRVFSQSFTKLDSLKLFKSNGMGFNGLSGHFPILEQRATSVKEGLGCRLRLIVSDYSSEVLTMMESVSLNLIKKV